MRSRRPKDCDAPSPGLRAVARIVGALRELDLARASLSDAADELLTAVNHPQTPESVRQDFERFQRCGGVTVAQYSEWLNGGLPRQPVPRTKHLRLVHTQAARKLTRYRPSGRGPEAA
jgi:hypothetical protein